MHNSFILQRYVCYTTMFNMFRAARCSSSGGQIVSPLSVNSRTVCLHIVLYREWRYQRLWRYNWSSWGWAACCSKHVEDV